MWALRQSYTSAIGLIFTVPTLLGQCLFPERPMQPVAGPASGGRPDGHRSVGCHKHQCSQAWRCSERQALLYVSRALLLALAFIRFTMSLSLWPSWVV